MQILKIVVTGSYAAGKTHFIQAISDIEPVSTEQFVSDAAEQEIKTMTTVGLDFGTIAINDDLALFLFGTPGQERFDFMWETLSIGCMGYLVLVDSCRPAHFVETARLMKRFQELTDAPFMVVANKQDDPTALPPAYIAERLSLAPEVPIVPCVAIDRESVKTVLLALLDHIDRYVGRAAAEE